MSCVNDTVVDSASGDANLGALDLVEQQALAWVDCLVSGEATDRDAIAVRRWCEFNPTHARAFAEAIHLWRLLGLVDGAFAKEGGLSDGPGGDRARKTRKGAPLTPDPGPRLPLIHDAGIKLSE